MSHVILGLVTSALQLPLVTHVTPARDLTQFNSTHGVESIKYIFRVSSKAQLLERRGSEVSSRDVSCDFFCPC